MLKRSTFVRAIQAIRKQQLTEKLNAVYREMTDEQGRLVLDGLAHAAPLQTLIEGVEDEYKYIEWWLCEAPDDDKVDTWEEDGCIVSVDLDDVIDLYDYLVWSAKERKRAQKLSGKRQKS